MYGLPQVFAAFFGVHRALALRRNWAAAMARVRDSSTSAVAARAAPRAVRVGQTATTKHYAQFW